MKSLLRHCFATLAIVVSFSASSANAQVKEGIFSIPGGGTAMINKHGVCRNVKNTNGNPVMVPTGTANEWSSGARAFLSNLATMPGIDVSSCAHPDSPVLAQMAHETCYWGDSAREPLDCYYTRGPKAGQSISNPSPQAGTLWMSTIPLCLFEGKTRNFIVSNPTNTPTNNPDRDIPWEKMMKLLNLEHPIDDLRFPTGVDECRLNTQINHSGSTAGFWVSYIFRR